ncbi:MAG: hypothetical protein ACJ8F7_04550 [Gemmataceae bacterium]
MSNDAEILVGMSAEELQALADGILAPAAHTRLDDLLARKNDRQIAAAEEAELDTLLRQVDQLTILKTRARYTLTREKALAAQT